MTTNHYDITSNTIAGSEIKQSLTQLATAWDRFTRIRGVLIENKDTGQSGAAAYASIATRYGYVDSTEAKASFEEMDSAFGNSNAAITQMLNRHL